MPEWSKGVHSSCTVFVLVGSNPTSFIFKLLTANKSFYLQKKKIVTCKKVHVAQLDSAHDF